MFFEWEKLNPNKKLLGQNHKTETILCNLWFHHHFHNQPYLRGFCTNSWPHNIPPRVGPHCQLLSLLVHWSYGKKTTHAIHYKCGGKLEKGKPQKLGDSSNNAIEQVPGNLQEIYEKGVLWKFRRNHRKIPVPDSLS